MRRVLVSPSSYWTRVGRRRFQLHVCDTSIAASASRVGFAPSDTRRRLQSSQPLPKHGENTSLLAEQNVEIKQRDEPLQSENAQLRRRQTAAKAVPFWLDNDVACFEQTMNALDLDFSLPTTSKLRTNWMRNGPTNGDSSLLAEYRQLYKDSIVSFSQILSENPSSLSPNLEPALERLVDVGFADLRWAKHFRKFRNFNNDFRGYNRRLKEKQRRHRNLAAKLELAKKDLDEIERKAEAEKEKLVIKKNGTPNTLIGRVVDTISSLWNTESEDENKIEMAKDAIVNNYKRKLEKQRRTVNNAQESVDRTEKQIRRLQADRDNYKPRLTVEEYDQANRVVEQVLEDISVAFAAHIRQRHSRMFEQYQVLDSKTDLTKPHEWYLHARLDRRKIIFHGGPTNSGKTYSALQRLKNADRGLYLGPLRLLAAEVYEDLTSQGIYTSLYTGQEKRVVPFATHSAATVEMAPTTEDFDTVVIDEIQMLSDPFRGFAWTRALLGIRCKEIHVCGGLEAEDIVRRMAEFCGDEFEVQRYERFSELHVAEKSISETPKALGSYSLVQPGDCVVAFSRNDIFAIRREIEMTTKHKCCVIYGSLPPETRTDQARRFNDPDSGYDILVASDAIGMGLNLNIRRVIFNSMFKSNGESIVRLDHSGVKQISGRAGRRNSPYPNGEVTCRDPEDLEYLRECMNENVATIEKAGLLPTSEHIQHFSEALQKYELGDGYDNLHKMLIQFDDMAKTKGDFFICRQTPMLVISRLLDYLPLSINDKYDLCMAPAAINNQYSLRTLQKFAEKYAAGEAPGLSGNLIPRPAKTFEDLSRLCGIHNELELFLWLSTKFPGNAVEQQTAQAMKEELITHINKGLNASKNLKLKHCYIERDTKLRENWKKTRDSKDLAHGIDSFDDYLVPPRQSELKQRWVA